MGDHDGTKLFALRVQNITRSCVLLKQFKSSDVWGMPTLSIPYTDDPMDHLDRILEQVDRNDKFRIVSATSIIDYVQEDRAGSEHHSIIYDLRYTGRVLPGLTAYDEHLYAKSKWVQKGMLASFKSINYPLGAYIDATEKESCLR